MITRGEPHLQQGNLVILFILLKNRKKINGFDYPKYRIEIETNGTITPNKELVELIDQWNISPKTSNSSNEKQDINLDKFYCKSLPYYKNLQNTFFKFIVDKLEDIKEIDQFIKNMNYRIKE